MFIKFMYFVHNFKFVDLISFYVFINLGFMLELLCKSKDEEISRLKLIVRLNETGNELLPFANIDMV